MADDEQDVDVVEEGQSSTFPLINTLAEFKDVVLADEEFLVVVVVTSSHCQYSTDLLPFFTELSTPKPQTSKAKFVRLHMPGAEEAVASLKLCKTPSVLFYLKGELRAEPFSGTNKDRIAGMFRNELITRNEVMKEYDEAKLAAMRPPEAEEEKEEGEGEEDE